MRRSLQVASLKEVDLRLCLGHKKNIYYGTMGNQQLAYIYICMCFQSVVRMTANRICKIGLDDQKIEFYHSAKRSLFTLHWSALVCSCD